VTKVPDQGILTGTNRFGKVLHMPERTMTAWETTEQVMKRLHTSRQTLYKYLEAGLPSHQPGGPNSTRLFDPIEVDEWVRSRCSDPSAGEAA
jgi:predicted DNA-binding transcriptional regulator AlpA